MQRSLPSSSYPARSTLSTTARANYVIPLTKFSAIHLVWGYTALLWKRDVLHWKGRRSTVIEFQKNLVNVKYWNLFFLNVIYQLETTLKKVVIAKCNKIRNKPLISYAIELYLKVQATELTFVLFVFVLIFFYTLKKDILLIKMEDIAWLAMV